MIRTSHPIQRTEQTDRNRPPPGNRETIARWLCARYGSGVFSTLHASGQDQWLADAEALLHKWTSSTSYRKSRRKKYRAKVKRQKQQLDVLRSDRPALAHAIDSVCVDTAPLLEEFELISDAELRERALAELNGLLTAARGAERRAIAEALSAAGMELCCRYVSPKQRNNGRSSE